RGGCAIPPRMSAKRLSGSSRRSGRRDGLRGARRRRAAYAKDKEEYLADGIVHLRLARQGEFGMQRQLRVVKMRGTRHETGYHALVFDNGWKVTRILA
ncbi:MAG: ATPase domain-containing protein, partial [Thermoplasmata archaeon]